MSPQNKISHNTPSGSDDVTAIGVVAYEKDDAWIVPRTTHRDGTMGEVPDNIITQYGIRLTGAVLVTDPGTLIAVRGNRDENSIRVSDTRTARVLDVFTFRPSIRGNAAPVFAKPKATAEHEQWETRMLRAGDIVSRRYLRAEDGSWRVVVGTQNIESVRTPLRDAYGEQLTLVEVDWARSQFDAVRRELSDRRDEWKIMVLLDGTSERGVPALRVGIHEVTDDVRAWHRTLPPSMVELFPFLAADSVTNGFDDESRDFLHRSVSP